MKAIIKPSILKGSINAPKSKSIMHRYLICKYLSNDLNFDISEFCEDNIITYNALVNFKNNEKLLMGNSASTFRFLLPISFALGLNKTFVLSDGLLMRPLDFLHETFGNHGVKFLQNGNEIVTCGKLTSGKFYVDSSISSQLISGLMFALPLLDGDSEIILKDDFVSKQYVDMTISVLNKFGVEILTTQNGYYVQGNQKYKNTSFGVSGDYSSAAYYNVLNKLGSSIKLVGLSNEIEQGDSIIEKWLNSTECVFDLKNNIDLAPIICAYLAVNGNASKIININTLKYKESNRIDEIITLLKCFSINAEYRGMNNGSIIINGGTLKNVKEFASKDHRLLMAGVVLGTLVGGTINGVEYINKSYPNFINDLISLGADICLID